MRRCTKGQLRIQLDFGPTLLPISTGKRNGASQSALRILTSGMEISRLRYSNFQVNSIYFIFLVFVLIVCNVGGIGFCEQWFKGGRTNICYNCLDRNIESGNGGKVAIYWEGNEPGFDASLTYAQLLDKVCQVKMVSSNQILGIKAINENLHRCLVMWCEIWILYVYLVTACKLLERYGC